MIDPKHTVVVANPAAAAGRIGRTREALLRKLRAGLGACEVLFTKARGDATELAAQARAAGATPVVSLGGDGTHNEVVNGLLRAGAPSPVQLGLLSAGTGGDFCRVTLAGHDLDAGIRAISESPAAYIDVGLTRYRSDAGARAERYFLNMASCGVSGLVCRLVEQSGKRLGGGVAFYLATVRALWRYKPARLRIVLDGQQVSEADGTEVTTVAVCNGQYAGGGMRFGPSARLTDGQLDVVIIRPTSLLAQLRNTPKLYKGEHGAVPGVSQHRGRRLQVEPVSERPAYIEFDGEAPGVAPAEFAILPAALPVLGLSPWAL
jgi:YegS/Rv2252/BmrU family lipid kinase